MATDYHWPADQGSRHVCGVYAFSSQSTENNSTRHSTFNVSAILLLRGCDSGGEPVSQ